MAWIGCTQHALLQLDEAPLVIDPVYSYFARLTYVIDWSSRFKDTLKPVFNDLYDSVKNGTETQRSLDFNSQSDYREKYEQEMQQIRDLEIWRAGKAVR